MIPSGYNETSSRPPTRLEVEFLLCTPVEVNSGTAGLCCGVALVTALAASKVRMTNASICSCSSAFGRPPMPPAACNMPWFRKEPAGGRGKYGKTIMITSAGIRRIAVRLMLAFRTLEGNMSRLSLEELPSVMTVDEVSSVLGICSKTCCKLIREKQLHGVKVGRSYRIAKSELFRFLKVLPNDREEHRSSQYQTDIFREG